MRKKKIITSKLSILKEKNLLNMILQIRILDNTTITCWKNLPPAFAFYCK